ncbi:MAG: c-type cytochrome [Desulfuromonadaceae bacterium]|nr:c-type cytochrome [Desulfuromonadaceae bacterium]
MMNQRTVKKKNTRSDLRILLAVLAVVGVVCVGYYLVSGWNSRPGSSAVRKTLDSNTPPGHKAVEERAAAGRQLFGTLCVGCHGKSARGGVGPDLTVSTYKYGRSRLEITKTITNGRPGGMPSFGSRVDKEQIESLVEFVITLNRVP